MDSEQRALAIASEILYQWLKGEETENEPLLIEVEGTDDYEDTISELRRIRDELLTRSGQR